MIWFRGLTGNLLHNSSFLILSYPFTPAGLISNLFYSFTFHLFHFIPFSIDYVQILPIQFICYLFMLSSLTFNAFLCP